MGKYTFTGAKTSSLFILMSQLFPAVVVIIPLFEMLKWLSLLNSHAGLILAYMLLTLPVTTWMLKGFFENIPDNILRAARIDGLSEFQIFREIALPLVLPGIASTAIYCFVLAWQEFILALTFLQDGAKYTLPVGLMGFIEQNQIEWGLLLAGSFVTVLPAAVTFMFLQRYFIRSLAGRARRGNIPN